MENRLKDIRLRIERLLGKYTSLLQEHNSLLMENHLIKDQLDELKTKNEQIEQKNIELSDSLQELTLKLAELSVNGHVNSNEAILALNKLNGTSSESNLNTAQSRSKFVPSNASSSNLDLFSDIDSTQFNLNEELRDQVESLEIRINSLKGDNDLLRMNLSRKDAFILQLETEKRQLKIKISDLEEEIALKENTIEIQKNTLNDLKEQNKLIKLAKEMSPDKSDNHELKIKINELVRDIDRCIDLLND
jgi:chromosome segregation ATPase